VPGRTPVSMALQHATSSAAPDPPSIWPVRLLVDETIRPAVAWSPKAFLMATVSARSPRTVLVPLGSNGTAAGLLLGLPLGCLGYVNAVQVSHMPTVGARSVARLANAAARLLRHHGAPIAPLSFRPRDLTVFSEAKTRRYGHPTPEAEEAKELLRRLENLALDSTFTAKTVAALIARPELPRPLLYWHTFNAHPLPTSF